MAKTTSKNPQVGKITDEEERKKALSNTLGAIEKQFGKGAIMKLGEKTAMNVQAIPSGSLGAGYRAGRRRRAARTHHRDLRAGILR